MRENGVLESDYGTNLPRPFLKWAGGKTGLLYRLRNLVPKKFCTYIEPFVGGGALFFDLRPDKAVLSDLNAELMNCYRVVKENPEGLLRLLEAIPVNMPAYYSIRKQDPVTLNKIERAARFIYLNKTCYNGLYRVNRKGQFNTPFGKYERARVCDCAVIRAASRVLREAVLLDGDFEPILRANAKPGDFVYLDPPYPPVGVFSDFKRYTKEFFYERDQIRLAKAIEDLDRKGCKFILSNAKHDLVEQLYSKFRKIDVEAPRNINCRGSGRGSVPELLITNLQTC